LFKRLSDVPEDVRVGLLLLLHQHARWWQVLHTRVG
jgi:hypothetical protein